MGLKKAQPHISCYKVKCFLSKHTCSIAAFPILQSDKIKVCRAGGATIGGGDDSAPAVSSDPSVTIEIIESDCIASARILNAVNMRNAYGSYIRNMH